MGYQDAVQQELGDAAAVWGPEENGGNSQNVLTHLDEWVLSRKPDMVHINCGLHDLRKELDGSGPPVPLAMANKRARFLWRTPMFLDHKRVLVFSAHCRGFLLASRW